MLSAADVCQGKPVCNGRLQFKSRGFILKGVMADNRAVQCSCRIDSVFCHPCRTAHHSRTSRSAGVLEWASTQLRFCHSLCRQTFLLLLLFFPDGLAALPLDAHNLKPALPPIVKDKPFLVTWNAPTARCSAAYNVPLHLDSYGILVNSQEAFVGGNITIFYYDQLGLYPYYVNTTVPPTAVHGGCPQNVSLKDHLEKMRKDIAMAMPSHSFAGLAVIDWENWRPQWIRNWDKKNIYRDMSLLLVKQRNPHLSDYEAELEAKWEFEAAAQNFMTDTLRLAQSLRPNGWWGYYLFPDCYNYDYLDDFEGFTGQCPPVEVQRNNELSWLWENSRALYPSIYMEEMLRTSLQGKRFVRAKVGEALRVAELSSAQHSLPVFVYARPFYTYTLKELSQVRFFHCFTFASPWTLVLSPAQFLGIKNSVLVLEVSVN